MGGSPYLNVALFYTWSVNPGGTDFWVLPINNSEGFYGAFATALNMLTMPANWEQAGSITVQQAVIAASEMFADMFQLPDPVGTIWPYAGDPSGLAPGALSCDGASYNTTDYPALFGVIGYAYGGSGSIFQVPDLRARFPAGAGGSLLGTAVSLGSVGGAESHSQTVSELATHTHVDSGHAHTEIGAVSTLINGGLEAPASSAVPVSSSTGIATANIQNAGSGDAMPTVPPYLGVNYIILTGQP